MLLVSLILVQLNPLSSTCRYHVSQLYEFHEPYADLTTYGYWRQETGEIHISCCLPREDLTPDTQEPKRYFPSPRISILNNTTSFVSVAMAKGAMFLSN